MASANDHDGHPAASARDRSVRRVHRVRERCRDLSGRLIWATGFGTDHTWIEADILDQHGRIVQQRGVTPAPGLFVLGLPWMLTRGSALLGWVGADAAQLARQIGPRSTSRAGGVRAASREVVAASATIW